MKIIKSILFILLVIMAQGIVGFLEYRYLSITLGIFAIFLIVFVQALQMILEYHIFSKKISWLAKLFYGMVIIGIMAMNINYLQLSREEFDNEDIEARIEARYQEKLENYNILVAQYQEEFQSYKQSIQSQKELADINHQAEFESYQSLLNQYEEKKSFIESQINNIDSRISTLQKSINRWGATDEDREKVQNEIKELNKQKNDLLDSYNNISPPEPPERDNINIEPFTKERPERPVKDDIKIEKDQRLVILYWLIAGILELGSLALLFLLNNTLNVDKKAKSNKTTSYESEMKIKQNQKTNDKMDNKSLIQHNVSMINDNVKSLNENGKVKQKLPANGKSRISSNDEKTKNYDNQNNEYNDNIRKSLSNNGNWKKKQNLTQEESKKDIESDKKDDMNLDNHLNNKQVNNINKNDNNISSHIKFNNKDENHNNTVNKDKESETINKMESSKKNGKSLISSMLNEIERIEKSEKEPDKEKDSNKKELINDAIEDIKNMTIYQRKLFAEKLSEELDKPISFKTLGVWASRNYIPNKKVDIVLKLLNPSHTH